jgi:hypothetical protein
MKDTYSITQSQIQLACMLMASVRGRMTGNAASGRCESYHVIGKHVYCKLVFK